jgi:hypothetical protein
MLIVYFTLLRNSNQPEDSSQLEPKHVVESNDVRINFNKIINWVVFDYILLKFYNSIQHNGDVSPRSPFLHTHFICLMINTSYFISEVF